MALFLREARELGFVANGAPKPRGDRFLLDAREMRGEARFAEIFLRQDVGRHLRPVLGHFHVLEAEHDRAVGVANLARRRAERNLRVG